MNVLNDSYVSIKDIKTGQKNLNVVFIVLEIGKCAPCVGEKKCNKCLADTWAQLELAPPAAAAAAHDEVTAGGSDLYLFMTKFQFCFPFQFFTQAELQKLKMVMK